MRALLLSLLLLSGCGSLSASPVRLIDVEVVSGTSASPLQRHAHRGEWWIAGTPGERYALRLTNRSGERVLAVLSVDGVNVISGETAGAGQSGYVIEPWASAEIGGWRKSMQEVAAFYFTALPDSYAARSGRPDDVGVIGVAAFRERPRPQVLAPPLAAPRGQGSAPAGESAAAADAAGSRAERSLAREAQKLGTGHGERRWAPTTYTAFERATAAPEQVLAIRYDARERLVARGIIAPAPRHAQPAPRPFPGDGGFVPDPS